MARNPEFDYDCFLSWSTLMIRNAEREFSEALHLPERFCNSQRQKEENHKEVHGKVISKIKEKLISHLKLDLVVLRSSSVSLSARMAKPLLTSVT